MPVNVNLRSRLSLMLCAAAVTAIWANVSAAQGDPGIPHLHKHGTATQLIVDGKPFLILGGELGNNTASTLENMEPVWPKLISANLNTVLVAISWTQLEPEKGKFDFSLVDGLIAKARDNNLHLVFLWFGSWKNGLSSYAPYWVKKDFARYPRVQLQSGKEIEMLSTFGDATRDADAAAFSALMRHIKETDGARHTVVMMQVENELGVLGDTRDRSPAANRAYAGPVPKELMDYLESHIHTLSPELYQVWAANGLKKSGSWSEVFGSGKPPNVEIPLLTLTPPLSEEEHETDWKKPHWPSDEYFMAWNYARYVGKVIQAGKAQYNIPMYLNCTMQQPNKAWPGVYNSGAPLPEVQDIWRAAAPQADIFTADLYWASAMPYFEETLERFSRNGNPLFIAETTANAANAIMALGKYNSIGFSPFAIESRPNPGLAATYNILAQMSPMILARQGTGSMTAVRLNRGDEPKKVRLGNYTLEVSYIGSGFVPNQRSPLAAAIPRPAAAQSPMRPMGSPEPMQAAAVLIASGPDEFYLGGGGIRIAFTPDTPGPPEVGLGIVQQGKFVDGKWELIRQLGGDDTAQGESLTLRPDTILRVTLYRYP